jgi:general secretion pathway protein F
MPRYRYSAVDSQGKPASGEVEAAGVEAARQELAAAGLEPKSISLSEIPPPSPRGGWLSTEETVELARGLAQLTKASLTLAGGLRALADELPGGRRPYVLWYLARLVGLADHRTPQEARLPGVLRAMSSQLEAGATLESVIAAQGPRFPAHLRGLVLAGLRSGRLAEVLEEFVDLERAQLELRRRLWLSLAYPIVLLSILTLLLAFLQFVLTPAFVRIFHDFQTRLPLVTEFFLRTVGPATWFLGGGLLLLAVIVFLVVAMPKVAWVPPLLYGVPLIGPLWRFGRLVQFSRLMAVLLEQEVPLPEALRLTAAGVRDGYLAEGCRRVADGVEAGRPLAECLASQRRFPPSMVPLVDWGQRASAMADAFRASAEMFQGRLQTQGLFLETVLLPVTFLMIALFIGFFIVAMFLPLISLIQALKQ